MRLSQPEDFSYLLDDLLTSAHGDLESAAKFFYDKYPTFKKLASDLDSNKIIVGRGITNIAIERGSDLVHILKAYEKLSNLKYTSWSMNLPFANLRFGNPITRKRPEREGKAPEKRGKKKLKEELFNLRKYLKEREASIQKYKKFKNNPFAPVSLLKKAKRTDISPRFLEQGIFIVAKIPVENVIYYGGDSESHIFEEAELHVKSYIDYIQRVFILSPFEINYPLASLEEQKKYSLTYLNKIHIPYDWAKDETEYNPNNLFWSQDIHMHVNVKAHFPYSQMKKFRGPKDNFWLAPSLNYKWYRMI